MSRASEWPRGGHVLIIEPGRVDRNYWYDLWRYRHLMVLIAWRDIAVRYKQTVIGIGWALIRPALTMLVFVAFRRLAKFPPGEIPEPLLVFAAVLPWQLFSAGLADSAGSLIGNANLISKVYFPRLIIPCAAIITSFGDFLITICLLGLLMAWYGFVPGPQLAALPLFVLLTLMLAAGIGFLFAALNVEYRDFRYVVPFIVQFGLFISPIAFTSANVPERWRALYALNPLAGIIDGFRWSILGGRTPCDPETIAASVVVTTALLLIGVWYFRHMERGFADVI